MIIPALDLIDGTVVRLHQATTPGSGITVTILPCLQDYAAQAPGCCIW